jgi:hypothetical protein
MRGNFTAERAREPLNYDPGTEVLTWKVGKRAGQRAAAADAHHIPVIRLGRSWRSWRVPVPQLRRMIDGEAA